MRNLKEPEVRRRGTGNRNEDVRLVDATVAEQALGDRAEDARQRGRLLLDRARVVHVVVPHLLDLGREVAEEN